MDAYYDEQKRLIATNIDELIIFFQSIGGVTIVENVVYDLPCPMVALIRMNGSENLPKFIYKNGLTPTNKIYLQAQPINGNIASLCNGTTYDNIVPIPVIGNPYSETYNYITNQALDILITQDFQKLTTQN